MNSIVIHSSQGDIVVAARDGHVIKINAGVDADSVFTRIFKFDLKEWMAQWGHPLPTEMDILDVGYWYTKTDATVHYEEPENEWRANLIEECPIHASRRAKTLLNDAAGMLAAAQCQLEPHNKLAGESGQCNSLRQEVVDHAGRLFARMDQLMDEDEDEDPLLPADYDPGDDLGLLGNSLGCHMMPSDRAAFDRVQQHIVQLQHNQQPKPTAGKRFCDVRDLNCIAEKLYGVTEAGEDEPAQNALARLGRDLCGPALASGDDSPPVWE